MLPELHIPGFARIDEYVGVWSMEPTAFCAMWQALARMDVAAHMSQEPPKLVSQTEMVQGRDGRSVAIVPLMGTLMKQRSSMGGTSTIQARRDIRQAAADPNVSAILLAIESPGGAVAGTDDLATEVKAARARKPVWAHVDDLAASAAYWVASQAEKIVANSPTAMVGSIGTMLSVYDRSAQAERDGIKTFVFKTGPLKGLGIPGTPITDEQAAHLQGIVNGVQAHFDEAVRSGRSLSRTELESVRTGGVWKADAAKDLKLIDAIQPLSKTIDMLAKAADQPRRSTPAAALPMLSQTLPMKG